MDMTYDYDVFISYSHKDEDWVLNILLPTLEQQGVKTCIDFRDFLAGTAAIVNMQDAIKKSHHALLVLTTNWVESEWTLYESILMRTKDPGGLQRRTIPLLLEKCEVPEFISILTWVDFTSKTREKQAWENLFKSLEVSVSTPDLAVEKLIGGLPFGSYVPFVQNTNFTGREKDLKALAENLLQRKATNTVISQAVTGMGGLGKTQLAVEFAHRYGGRFKGVHWLDLREPQALDGAIALCGTKMGYTQVNQPELIASTLKTWIEDGPRLLILDNFENVREANDVLARFQHSSLRILITSRRKDFPKTSGLQVQELGLFSEAESLDFLKKALNSDEILEIQKVLAKELGYLPLALELAAKYINIAGIGIGGYLAELVNVSKLESEQVKWFKELDVTNPTQHDQSLFSTFQLSWQEVKDDIQRKIFMIAGYCAPNMPIPREIFKETLGLGNKDLKKALYRLNTLGLLSIDDEFDKLPMPSIHPLLAAYARTWSVNSKELLENLAGKLAMLAKQANNQMDLTGSPGWFVPLHPHIIIIIEAARLVDQKDTALLLSNLGHYLNTVADYRGAKSAYEQALKINEATFGPYHPNVATAVNNLGSVLQALDNLAGAEIAFERALKIDEAVHGLNDKTVAIDVNNLGSVKKALGDLVGAKAAFERALKIAQGVHGPRHPTVGTISSNLGGVLQDLGDLAGARAAYMWALKVAEASYGPNHPKVASVSNNLGGVMQAQGDLADAQAAYERALRIFKNFLPEGHPNIRIVQGNLDTVSKRKQER
jgi:tetratricopeptide (TPR) repeat protein